MTQDPNRTADRALAALRADPHARATPPAGLAARVAAHALAQPTPSLMDELIGAVHALVRPAAGLACATALVLGVASAATGVRGGDGGGASRVSARADLSFVTDDDVLRAVLPFSTTAQSSAHGGGR